VRGRWADVREPTEQEMKLTTVLVVAVDGGVGEDSHRATAR
jgi:hypothetical protein